MLRAERENAIRDVPALVKYQIELEDGKLYRIDDGGRTPETSGISKIEQIVTHARNRTATAARARLAAPKITAPIGRPGGLGEATQSGSTHLRDLKMYMK